MNQVANKIRELIEYLNYHTKCYDEGHTLYVAHVQNWEVRIDVEAKTVLTVDNLSHISNI